MFNCKRTAMVGTLAVAIFLSLLTLCYTDSWADCKGVTSAGNVKGNNPAWTYIALVKNGSVLRITASGIVDFGCNFCSCVDSATAGVTGYKDTLQEVTQKLNALIVPPGEDPLVTNKRILDVYRKNYASTKTNYDQGGVWIKVVTKGSAPYIGTQLYYFWANSINKKGLPITEDVYVYAKAHDGGKSPDSTKSYGDNKGAYTVSISR